MSDLFSDMRKRVSELSIDLILGSLFKNEPDLQDLVIELNTQDQLFDEGIDSMGITLSSIGGEYAPVTIAMKRTEGEPFNRVTLKDKEDLYNSFEAYYIMGGLVVEADTIKEGIDLRERWGNNILGLTDESLDKLFFFLVPLMEEFIVEYITQDL